MGIGDCGRLNFNSLKLSLGRDVSGCRTEGGRHSATSLGLGEDGRRRAGNPTKDVPALFCISLFYFIIFYLFFLYSIIILL